MERSDRFYAQPEINGWQLIGDHLTWPSAVETVTNTLGSIMGALLAGLVLLPVLGLERLLAAGALLDMVLGVVLLARAETKPARRAALPALGGAIAAVAVALWLVRLDPLTLVSGVYRTGKLLDRS